PRLERDQSARDRLGEVALEHVAVERVHARRVRHRVRRLASERAGLARVRVDDVGAERAEARAQRGESAQIADAGDPAAEAGHALDVEAACDERVEQVALARLRQAGVQADGVAARDELRVRGERLARRAAEVEARQDAGDAHARPAGSWRSHTSPTIASRSRDGAAIASDARRARSGTRQATASNVGWAAAR